MAGYEDLIPQRENETQVRRTVTALQAGAHALLANGSATDNEIRLGVRIAERPRELAEQYFYQVWTSTTILGKLAAPGTITDADLLASVNEILPNVAKASA